MKLNNLDFMIAAQVEHPDRLRNVSICLEYLQKIKAKNVFVREYYSNNPLLRDIVERHNYNYTCKENIYDNFPRMQALNEIFEQTTSKFVIIYDTDIILTKSSLEQTVDLLSTTADVVYPYDGRFFDIPAKIVDKLNIDLTTEINLDECTLFHPNSVGGSTAYRRDVFNNGGKCNPNFKNTGYDDNELLARFSKLGYRIARAQGALLHMNHFRGDTSFNYNTFTENNQREFAKITNMSPDEIKQYIATWK